MSTNKNFNPKKSNVDDVFKSLKYVDALMTESAKVGISKEAKDSFESQLKAKLFEGNMPEESVEENRYTDKQSYEYPTYNYERQVKEDEVPEVPTADTTGEMPADEMPAGEMPAGEMPTDELPVEEPGAIATPTTDIDSPEDIDALVDQLIDKDIEESNEEADSLSLPEATRDAYNQEKTTNEMENKDNVKEGLFGPSEADVKKDFLKTIAAWAAKGYTKPTDQEFAQLMAQAKADKFQGKLGTTKDKKIIYRTAKDIKWAGGHGGGILGPYSEKTEEEKELQTIDEIIAEIENVKEGYESSPTGAETLTSKVASASKIDQSKGQGDAERAKIGAKYQTLGDDDLTSKLSAKGTAKKEIEDITDEVGTAKKVDQSKSQGKVKTAELGADYKALGDDDLTSEIKKESVFKSKALFILAEKYLALEDEMKALKFEHYKSLKANGILALAPNLSEDTRIALVKKFDECKSYKAIKALYESVITLIKEDKKGSIEEVVGKDNSLKIVKEERKVAKTDINESEEQKRIKFLSGEKGYGEQYFNY